jgi:hypothetical protein
MIETASLNEVSPFEDNLNGSRSPSAAPAKTNKKRTGARRRSRRQEEDEEAQIRADELHALMSHAAKWVAVHGEAFEELLRQKHGDAPGWSFLTEGEEGHAEFKLLLAREYEMAEAAKVGVLDAVQAAVIRRQGSVSLAEAAVQLVGEKTGAQLRPQAAADLVALGLESQDAEHRNDGDLAAGETTCLVGLRIRIFHGLTCHDGNARATRIPRRWRELLLGPAVGRRGRWRHGTQGSRTERLSWFALTVKKESPFHGCTSSRECGELAACSQPVCRPSLCLSRSQMGQSYQPS